jgi:hypothetical protein
VLLFGLGPRVVATVAASHQRVVNP